VFVFTRNPEAADMEAVAVVLAICDKFNPVIPDAGILNKLAPEPEKTPIKEPLVPMFVTLNRSIDALETVNTVFPVETDAVTPVVAILSVAKVAAVSIGAPFRRAVPKKLVEPVTDKVPIMFTLPESIEEPVLFIPVFPLIVPVFP
jgi:hypothetical protein